MKKIFYILSLAAASIALVSCVEEVKPHEPGGPEAAGCYGVYFPTQAASGDHVYNPTQDKVLDVTVARTNTSGAITVPVKMSFSEDGIFEVAPVTFADGQEETTVAIRFDKAKEGVNYSGSLVIEDNQYASLYNSNPIGLDFSVMCVEMKTLTDEKGSAVATLTFTDDIFWGEVHDDITIQYYEVDNIRYCKTVGGKLKSPADGTVGEGPWGTGCQISFKWYLKKTVEVDGVAYQWIEVEPNYMGYDSANGPVYMGDYFHMRADMGLSNGDYTSSYDRYTKGSDGYIPSYYDGHGGFVFHSAYWIHGTTSWYGYKDECPVGVASGYTRVNYDFELESDFSYGGKAPIYVTAGADVASIKYAVYPGELTATQVGNKVDAILAGTEATTEFSELVLDEATKKKYATLELTPATSGMYTFVAVAYDATKKAQNSGSVVFKCITAADEADHAVNVDVFTEDTPARYKNFHDYDSFAYCVSGEDLTEVHVAFYTEATVAKYGADVIFADAKADEDGSYALSEAQLAEVNADGGFYDILSGLKPETTYYVVVWATNGDLEEYAVDAYTTAKVPYVWNSLGKGLINDGFFNYLFNNKPETTASCDVYEEATKPGLYMVTGFQCAVCAGFFGISPDVMAQYEGGNWNNTEVVINATKPDAVTIEAQDYGICVNSAYGFFQIRSSKPGTLKDGVITFPAEGLDCYLSGYGWIPANDKGTFSVTLPSAVPASAPVKASAGNGVVENVAVSKTNVCEKAVTKYERDPKAVSVDVKVSYDRKVKDTFAKDSAVMSVK